MRNRIVSIFVVCVVVWAQIMVAEEPPETSGGYTNGRLWAHLSESSKLAFLRGIAEAGALCDTTGKANLYLFNETMAIEEIAKATDDFYRDQANVAVPVIGVYRFLALKALGAAAADLEAEVSRLRSAATRLRESGGR